MRYFAISESNQLEWQVGTLSQQIVEAYLEGTMAPPAGVVVPDRAPPKEHMDAESDVPTFKQLTFTKVTQHRILIDNWSFWINTRRPKVTQHLFWL